MAIDGLAHRNWVAAPQLSGEANGHRAPDSAVRAVPYRLTEPTFGCVALDAVQQTHEFDGVTEITGAHGEYSGPLPSSPKVPDDFAAVKAGGLRDRPARARPPLPSTGLSEARRRERVKRHCGSHSGTRRDAGPSPGAWAETMLPVDHHETDGEHA